MKIQRWLRNGELDSHTDTDDLLDEAGRRLDGAYVTDILGTPVFVGEDGKVYVVNVEAVIAEATPEFAKDMLDGEI